MSHRWTLPLFAVIGMLILALASISADSSSSVDSRETRRDLPQVPIDHSARVERGKYLVLIGGCNDCHTPWKMGENGPEPDMSRMLSGHPADVRLDPARFEPKGSWVWAGAATNTAFVGPWGVSYAFNLTPDPISGLGGVWNEEMFIRTLRTGKHFGESRDILPPMPWFNYGKMTDEDLRSVWAYLQSIPPVRNEVPPSKPAPRR
jgi:hypothetical protein